MAAWLTVYCARSLQPLAPKDILTGIDFTDFHTTAEGYGIDDEDAVDAALKHLRVEEVEQDDIVTRLRIRYRPGSARPVLLHLWTEPGHVGQECEEVLNELEMESGAGVRRITKHLENTIEIVALEMAWTQVADMGIVFAGQVAELLARRGEGLIRDQNENWWRMTKRGPSQIHQAN